MTTFGTGYGPISKPLCEERATLLEASKESIERGQGGLGGDNYSARCDEEYGDLCLRSHSCTHL